MRIRSGFQNNQFKKFKIFKLIRILRIYIHNKNLNFSWLQILSMKVVFFFALLQKITITLKLTKIENVLLRHQ